MRKILLFSAVFLFPRVCLADGAMGLGGLGTLFLGAAWFLVGIPGVVGALYLLRRTFVRATITPGGRTIFVNELHRVIAWMVLMLFGLFTYLLLGDLGAYSLSYGGPGDIRGAYMLFIAGATLGMVLLRATWEAKRLQPRSPGGWVLLLVNGLLSLGTILLILIIIIGICVDAGK